VIVVTEEGCENLTTCPRTVNEVESVMSGGPWPPLGLFKFSTLLQIFV
jgi:Xaa-Pro dipeptidase